MSAPNDHALIIGVEDYSAYDHSMDLPAGTSAVAGAINDAKTYFRQCISMGFAPDRIRVLTSPRLSPRDLGPEATEANVGDATHDAMVAGITWLAEAISGPRPSSGLLTFSGHGVQSRGVALCPSDTTGSLEQLVHVSALRRQVGRGEVADNLTMLLDCCHAAVGVDRETSLQARLRARSAGAGVEDVGVAERVIAACRRDQTSVSSLFGGERRGAFTWALTSAMGQWKVVEADGVAQLDAAYGELVTRARALLAALSFEQEPVLSGPAGVALLPFLHPGLSRHRGGIVAEPDAPRDHRQLDGGWYTFIDTAHNNVEIAQVFATAAYNITLGGAPAAASTELWYINQSAVAQLDQTSSLRILFRPLVSGQAYQPPAYAQMQTLQLAEYPGWAPNGSPLQPTLGGASFTFRGNNGSVWLQLVRAVGSTLSGIGWYNNVAPRNITPSGAFTRQGLPRSGYWAATWPT